MKKRIVLFLVALLLILPPVFEGQAKPFYEGKTLRLIVATKPGGGYDFYGRLAAKFMQKRLPGSTIIVRNIPGAGHIIGCNEIYRSKPDGLTFGSFERALPVVQVVGLKGVKFDLAKMSWLGSCTSDPRVLIVAKHTPYKTLDQVVKSEETIKFAAHGIGDMQYLETVVTSKMLGARNWKVVTGYAGGERELALMRGELDATFGSWGSHRPLVQDGEARLLMVTADKPLKGYEDVPLLPSLVGEQYKPVVELMLLMVKFNRPFAGPPGIPSSRLKILRGAFEKAWHDPELLKLAEKAGRPVNYISGEEGAKLTERALRQPPEIVQLFKEAYGVKD